MIRNIKREGRFFLKDRAALLWIAIAFILSIVAVTLGLTEVQSQRSELAALSSLDQEDRAAILSEQSDWGGAAYATFHLTTDPPSKFAFAALGQRDTSPWKHRIRMLALEGQIYETDAGNPDLALIGRFDFTFVVTLIAPLLIILLLFDIRSGERTAGRLNLIEASAHNPKRLWRARTIIRVATLTLALLIPLWVGGAIEGASIVAIVGASLAVAIYLAFWAWLSRRAASATQTGSVNLTILMGIWFSLCAVLPAALTASINQAVSLPDTGEIMLTQREAVNDAWDLPKAATMDPFVAEHPEWADFAQIDNPFEWKWYFAFQQVGDHTVEPYSLAYRQGRMRRDDLAGWSGLISPATALQRVLERLARTDAKASLAYEERVRDFHAELRNWHYPKLFEGQPFSIESFDDLPVFQSASQPQQ